jgi:hypothetical protein
MLVSTIGSSNYLAVFEGQCQRASESSTDSSRQHYDINLTWHHLTFIAGPVNRQDGRKWVMVITCWGMVWSICSMAARRLLAIFANRGFGGHSNRSTGRERMRAADLVPEENELIWHIPFCAEFTLTGRFHWAGHWWIPCFHVLHYRLPLCRRRDVHLRLMMLISEGDPTHAGGKDRKTAKMPTEKLGGYLKIFRDRPFMYYISIYAISSFAPRSSGSLPGVLQAT